MGTSNHLKNPELRNLETSHLSHMDESALSEGSIFANKIEKSNVR